MTGRLLRGSGELLITAGVVVLLFVVYLLYWTGLENSRDQSRLSGDFDRAVQAASGAGAAAGARPVAGPGIPAYVPGRLPRLGTAEARIYIPRLGTSDIMVEGTGTAELQLGIGHVTASVQPGADGNFAASGHRTTYGEPFNRLDEVKPNDHVVVETPTQFVTYRVVGTEVVDPGDGIVVTDATPAIGAQPADARRLLTFTTCTPKYSAESRLVLRAVWERTDAHAVGRPPALQQGV